MRQFAIALVLAVLAIALFLWGANRQGVLVNTDMHSTDQGAYMNYAKAIAQTNFQYVGGRNRMPIYPALMSFLYSDEMSDEELFRRGKAAGIVIALVVAFVAFFLFRQNAPLLDSVVATLVVLLTVFAYKAPYFQAEILFYGITLVLFYLLLSLVRKPKITTAALAGITAGIGHLTKASVLPALLLAALCVLIGVTSPKCQQNVPKADTSPSSQVRHLLARMFYVIILLVCFLVVVFPYIRTSKERFGRYFYNVNSTFYMWYDSWGEAKQGTRAHGDRQGWPDMPEDQIPSFQKYVREHSLGSIVRRFARGLCDLRGSVTRSYGYAEFLVAYVIAALLLFGRNLRRTRSILIRTNLCSILFIALYFLGYTLLYAWYTPIAGGNRFVLSLFLPALLILLQLISHAQSDDLRFVCFGRELPASAASPFVLLFLVAYLLTVFPHGVSTMYGGR